MRNNDGFTLIELILVTIIIGILAGMVVMNVVGVSTQAKIRRARLDIANYQTAVDRYALDHNDKYPKSLNDLVGGKTDYLRDIKKDPWGNPYIYECPGKHYKKSYDIYSRGPDGQAGNEDDVAPWKEYDD